MRLRGLDSITARDFDFVCELDGVKGYSVKAAEKCPKPTPPLR